MGFKARRTSSKSAPSGKRFMFLTFGFEKPTPEVMAAWGAWFGSMADRIDEQGGFWSGGHEISEAGTTPLPFGPESITGYMIFRAADLAEAVSLAEGCPYVASNRVYEIMSK